jgi:hypothetical protein
MVIGLNHKVSTKIIEKLTGTNLSVFADYRSNLAPIYKLSP